MRPGDFRLIGEASPLEPLIGWLLLIFFVYLFLLRFKR